MRLSCGDVEPLVQDYLDGYLLPSQRELLEEHVRACPACAGVLTGLARLDEGLARLEPVEAPPRLAQSILAALPAEAYRFSFARLVAPYAAVPALIGLLLVVGVFLAGSRFPGAPAPGTPVAGLAAPREVDVVFVAPGAATVAVVGDFNGWDPNRNPMTRGRDQEAWRARLVLPPGVYQYNFVVDGSVWEKDPQAKNFLADGFGGVNSVIVVDG